MKKKLPIIIGTIVVIAAAWYAISSGIFSGGKSVPAENVVAIVNKEKISRVDFETLGSQIAAQQGIDITSLDEETKITFETNVINELVTQTLLKQAVKKSGTTASQEDIDAQISAIKTRLGSDESFQQALATEGLSEESLRSQIGTNLATQTYLEQELSMSSISASEEEINTTYAKVASENTNIPPLEDVRDQVKEMVIQQKQQSLFTQFIEQLRAKANIKILTQN